MAKIEPIPSLPGAIKEAAENNNLAIFIGAGASMLYGCDSWRQLANRLVECCFDKKNNFITYKEKEHLLNQHNSKKVLTICKNILIKNTKEELYHVELRKALTPKPAILPKDNLFDNLYKMGLGGGLYLTTNADDLFSSKFNGRIVYDPKKFNKNNIDTSTLYHLHGSITDIDSLVFTVPEYLKRYAQENSYLKFLQEVFNKYVVLFIGYGLEELEILEHLITKTKQMEENPKEVFSRYVLLGLYKGEENILSHEQTYYGELGIDVIGYQKDLKGYHQLEDVIASWSAQINQVSKVLPLNFDEIKEICDSCELKKISRIDHLIAQDKDRYNHFWKCLGNTPSPNKWLNVLFNRGEFSPEKSPSPIENPNRKGSYTIPFWEVLSFLENVSIKNQLVFDRKVTKTLKKILNDYYVYILKINEKDRNDRTEWFFSKIINNLPPEEITIVHIKMIKVFLNNYWGNTLIVSDLIECGAEHVFLTNNPKIILYFFDVVTGYKIVKNSYGQEVNSVIDEYWFNEMFQKHTLTFVKNLGVLGFDVLVKRINEIIRINKFSFGMTWIPAIDGSNSQFSDKYEAQVVKLATAFIENLQNKSDVNYVYKKLLIQKNGIFNRLLFHLFRFHFLTLRADFWRTFKNSPLELLDSKYEIYCFFTTNSKIFNSREISKIISWIDNLNCSYEKDKDRRVSLEAYKRKEWLMSLLDSRKKIVLDKFNYYEKLNPAQITHPGVSVWMESGFVSNISPYTLENLKSLSIEEQIKLINAFDGNLEEFRNKPSKEGLGECLEQLAISQPSLCVSNLNRYLELEEIYIYYILRGLNTEKGIGLFSEQLFLVSVKKYFNSINLWDFGNIHEKFSYGDAIIGEICSILGKILSRKNNNLTTDLILEISLLIIGIWDRLSYYESTNSDVPSLLLNTTWGKLFETMIELLLADARRQFMEHEVKWTDEHKTRFSNALNETPRKREFLGTMGKFFRNLLFIDSNWVWSNFDKIFSSNNLEEWKDVFSTLMFYMNDVYDVIYLKLKENGDYSRALVTTFHSSDISKRVVDHIVIAYLFSIEELENSLLSEVLESGNVENLKFIITFLAYRKNEENEERRGRILALWKKLYDTFLGQNSQTSNKILISLVRIQKHFDSLKVNFENLKHSFSVLTSDEYSYDLLEILERYVGNETNLVAQLILATIESNYFFSFKEDVLINVVDQIYLAGEKEIGDRICIAYLSKGINYLQDTYKKYDLNN